MTLRTLFATVCLLIMAACVARAQDAIDWIDLGNGVQAQAYFSPYESMDEKLLAALDMAADDSTVYMSYYSFSNSTYAKKFQELKARGVKVKLNLWDNSVSDRLNSYQDKGILQIFPNADDPSSGVIPNLRKPHSGSHDYYPASMHTKFTVVTPASGERIVVTGSANLSNSAALANFEHLIMIRSDAVAAEFEKEWREQREAGAIMRDALGAGTDEYPLSLPSEWTSSHQGFKAMRSKLWTLDARTDNSSPNLQTYFSPDDGVANKLMDQLNRAEKSIKVAIYVIAHDGIAETLAAKAAQGVEVTILANAGHEGMQGRASKRFFYGEPGGYEGFIADPNVHVVPIENDLGLYSKNHHKYVIVDDQIVVGGSFNWSWIATSASDENIVVVDHAEFAARFVKDFAMILERFEPVADLFADLDEDASSFLEASERPGHPHTRWAKANQDEPLTVDELRHYRMPFMNEGSTADATRVLFVVDFPKGDDYLKRGWDLIVIGEDPALKDGIALKNSRSTGNNFFGSAELPAGAEVEYRLALRKAGKTVNISDLLTSGGNGSGTPDVYHDGESRALATNAYGLPMIEELRWTGSNPLN